MRLFQVKPFVYVPLLAGLGGAAVFARGDWPTRSGSLHPLPLGVLCTSPFLIAAASLPADDRRFPTARRPVFSPAADAHQARSRRNVLAIGRPDAAVVPILRGSAYILLAVLMFFPLAWGSGFRAARCVARAARRARRGGL